MTTASTIPEQIAPAPAHSSSILILLRLEGLVVAAVAALLYARTGASWWLFAALWLVPDLSMFGYLAGPCQGARIYNAIHSYVARGRWLWLRCCCRERTRRSQLR